MRNVPRSFPLRSLVAILASVAAPAGAANFFVNNFFLDLPDAVLNGVCETAPGNGQCTLRAAVQEAEAQPADDTIFLFPGTVTLTEGPLPTHWSGSGPLTIYGFHFSASRISPAPTALSELISNFGSLYLYDLSLTGFESDGGAIYSPGSLTIDRCAFESNISSGPGGGSIYASAGSSLYIHDTAFAYGQAPGTRGGEILFRGTTFVCDGCIFEGASSGYGGAIDMELDFGASARIANSYFSGNVASYDGGAINADLALDGSLTIVNSTIRANRAFGNGGGVAIYGAGGNILSSTITGNEADDDHIGGGTGGGVRASSVFLANSILAGNIGTITVGQAVWDWPQDCAGSVTSNGYNIIKDFFTGCLPGDFSCCYTGGAPMGIDPLLAQPAYRGGPTPVLAIAPGSPAIDAGNPSGCQDGVEVLLTDQRGAERPAPGQGVCDLGAFEHGSLIFDDDFELWEWKWSSVAP